MNMGIHNLMTFHMHNDNREKGDLRLPNVKYHHVRWSLLMYKNVTKQAPLGFEPRISCLLDRRFAN